MINFAVVDQLELLHSHLRGRGKVFSSVAREIRKSSQMTPNLAKVNIPDWFGDVLQLDDDAAKAVERIRRNVFGGKPKEAFKHLGESETLHGMETLPELRGSTFLTDDEDAVLHARRQGIIVSTTCELLRAMCADGDMTSVRAHSLAGSMADQGRSLLEIPETHHWFGR